MRLTRGKRLLLPKIGGLYSFKYPQTKIRKMRDSIIVRVKPLSILGNEKYEESKSISFRV